MLDLGPTAGVRRDNLSLHRRWSSNGLWLLRLLMRVSRGEMFVAQRPVTKPSSTQ